MKINFVLLMLMLCVGCGKSNKDLFTPPPQSDADSAEEYIAEWSEMGMWLPDDKQIKYFKSNFEDSLTPLRKALSSDDERIRKRAAYVIGEVGENGRPAGKDLLDRLSVEPVPVVRMYIMDALSLIGMNSTETIALLKKRFDSLDGANVKPTPDYSYSEVDEKISAASALYLLSDDESKPEYFNFMTKWLSPPPKGLKGELLEGYWNRRLLVVNSLASMPDAIEAIPLLESMKNEEKAKPWVQGRVPSVLRILKNGKGE